MAVIDLTDDPRVDLSVAQSVGQGVGSYIGYKIGERRRQARDGVLVGTMQWAASENKTPEEALDELGRRIEQENVRITAQEQQEFFEQQSRRQVQKAQIEASKARTEKARRGEAGGAETITRFNQLKSTLTEVENQLDNVEPGSPEEQKLTTASNNIRNELIELSGKISQPPVDQRKFEETGFVRPTTKPSGFIEPGAVTELAKVPKQTKADAAIAKEVAPSAETEPPTQEVFEQTVTQLAKTDRAAAKAYYDRWANKWP